MRIIFIICIAWTMLSGCAADMASINRAAGLDGRIIDLLEVQEETKQLKQTNQTMVKLAAMGVPACITSSRQIRVSPPPPSIRSGKPGDGPSPGAQTIIAEDLQDDIGVMRALISEATERGLVKDQPNGNQAGGRERPGLSIFNLGDYASISTGVASNSNSAPGPTGETVGTSQLIGLLGKRVVPGWERAVNRGMVMISEAVPWLTVGSVANTGIEHAGTRTTYVDSLVTDSANRSTASRGSLLPGRIDDDHSDNSVRFAAPELQKAAE